MTSNLERALRWAAVCHVGQTRRGSGAPYIEHPVGVAMILDRIGFGEDVVIAGLLHDVVEDTGATLAEVRERFGAAVAELVRHGSEVKIDDQGRQRSWPDRKRDHLAALAGAPTAAKGVVLADKLHNLVSIACDLREALPVWSFFHADRDAVLAYYRAAIDTLGVEDPKLMTLAAECRTVLRNVENLGGMTDRSG